VAFSGDEANRITLAVPSSTNNQSQAEVSTSSGSGETPSATGGAARMSMDVVGLVAVGCFGLMVAL
jgi:hypothetical protein